MNNEIVFDKARIIAVEHRLSSGNLTSRIKVVAIATAEVAEALGAGWLLDKSSLVKHGFTSVELDYAIKKLRARHAIEDISALETTSEVAHRFRVFRLGGNLSTKTKDKKKSEQLMVSFVVEHSGSPFDILEHLMKVGAGEGICTLIPLQTEMFPENGKGAEPKKQAQQTKIPAAKKVAVSTSLSAVEAVLCRARTARTGSFDVTNDEGVFASARPLERYKGKGKSFWAELYAVEIFAITAWVCGYRVKVGHSGRESMPRCEGIPYETKEAALCAAAGAVITVADNVRNAGVRKHKTEAQAMLDWAIQFIPAGDAELTAEAATVE